MKKIFTLLTALLFAVAINAQTYEWYIEGNGQEKQVPDEGFFTTETISCQTVYHGVYTTVDGKKITCTSGVKMQGKTRVAFQTPRKSTVIIVQITSRAEEEAERIKFDGEALTGSVENPSAGDENIRVFTLNDVEPGAHEVTRVSQTGLMYVGVILEELKGEQLAAPEISFNETTGEVTISEVENATKIVYTTDGTYPTEESAEYTEPFIAGDQTSIHAMAIGDGENYANSDVSAALVELIGLDVEAPVIAQFNGTFAITCSTAHSTIEYSLDGENWVAYDYAVTLSENATVQARAKRDQWNDSEIATAEVEVLPVAESTNKTIYIGWASFTTHVANDKGKGTFAELVGEAGVENRAYGFKLVLNNSEKDWSSAEHIRIEEANYAYTGIKLSNGAQNSLVIPEGIKVNRVTFYSYINDSSTDPSGWKEVNGEDYNNEYKNIPMGCHSPGSNNNAVKPDVRVFNFDEAEGEITFTNGGRQLVFVLAVDIVVPTTANPSHAEKKYNLGDVIEFTCEEGATIYYRHGDEAPDHTNVFVEEQTPASAPLKVATDVNQDLTYSHTTHPLTFQGEPLNVKYIAHAEGKLPSEVQTLEVNGEGNTTGIESVAVDNNAAAVEYYNLQGQRVANPAAGLYIRVQGSDVKKVIL